MHEVVIDNSWGDGGKGLLTDWLATPDSVVVRFCGGAQAGHTVVSPDGRRHVFHHVGSGTFRGASTYLSRYFFCNPEVFLKELCVLRELGLDPVVRVSPIAPIVTVHDRLLNQLTELARGSARHGSCGHGIGEAAMRHETEVCRPTRLTYARLTYALRHGNISTVFDALDAWVIDEVARRNIDVDQAALRLDLERARTHFMNAAPMFLASTQPEDFKNLRKHPLVFEGAQGLLLDRDLGQFPFVTRAKTGLYNVEKLLGSLEDTRVWFVSRSYFTRHGAGPLPGEDPGLHYEDSTNVENPWQGRLRFAPRDEAVLQDARQRALAEVATKPAEVRTFVTWTDVPGSEHLRTDGWSDGPTREHCHVNTVS